MNKRFLYGKSYLAKTVPAKSGSGQNTNRRHHAHKETVQEVAKGGIRRQTLI